MSHVTTFDPFQQTFTLQNTSGSPFNVSLGDLDGFRLFGSQECIVMGVQIGACAILLIILILLTKPDKRTSAIFVLNSLALMFDIIRCVLESVYWTGPFVSTYAYLGQDFSQVPTGVYAQQVIGTVCTLLLQLCVEISLCIQAYVVCVNIRRTYRRGIIVISVLIALAALSVRFALMIENDIYIVKAEQESGLGLLDDAANITTTICICWFCAIFVGKLGFALRERKKLGMEQFGPMQIIFIVGCQTLLIPGKHQRAWSSMHKLTFHCSDFLRHELLRRCIFGFIRPHNGGTVLTSLIPLGFGFPRWSLSPIETEIFRSPND